MSPWQRPTYLWRLRRSRRPGGRPPALAALPTSERRSPRWSRRSPLGWARAAADAGMATAEYAVVTVAACGFAGLLVALLRSGEVRGLLLGIIRRALAG